MTEIVRQLKPAEAAGSAPKSLDFSLRVQARSDDGMRKSAETWAEIGGSQLSRWELHCDEGAGLNGEDSAPPPLAYFATGIAFCLLTQVTRAAEMRKVAIRDVKIDQTIHFCRTGSMKGGTIDTGVKELEYRLDIDSDEPDDEIDQLVRVATASCFAHAAMSEPVSVRSVLRVNGVEQDLSG